MNQALQASIPIEMLRRARSVSFHSDRNTFESNVSKRYFLRIIPDQQLAKQKALQASIRKEIIRRIVIACQSAD